MYVYRLLPGTKKPSTHHAYPLVKGFYFRPLIEGHENSKFSSVSFRRIKKGGFEKDERDKNGAA